MKTASGGSTGTPGRIGEVMLMEPLLSVRQRMILGILNTKKGMTRGSYLSAQLGVSDRTIRSDIQAMIPLLKAYGTNIESIRGRGYILHTDQPELLQKLTYRGETLMSSGERARDIALCLAERDDPLPVADLEEELFVSRSTLEADLRIIAKRYSEGIPHIRLIRSRQEIRFEADERKRRQLLNLLFTENWNYNYEAGMHVPYLPVEENEFQMIRRILLDFLRKNGIRMSEQNYVEFLFSIVIAVSRIRKGHEISEDSSRLCEAGYENPAHIRLSAGSVTGGKMRLIAEELAGMEGEAAGVTFSESEIDALADELAYRRYSDEAPVRFPDGNDELRNSFEKMIRTFLREVDEENGLALSGSPALCDALLSSLLSCEFNPYYTGMRHSEVIRSLKDAHPAATAAARRFARHFSEIFHKELPEETVMEAAAYIAETMERGADGAGRRKVRIALLSHLHISSSRYLMARMQTFFGERIDLSGPFSIYEYSFMEKDGCDFAVSTTKLKRGDQRPPVLVISPLLTKQDLENINFYLEEQLTKNLFQGKSCALAPLCQPEFHEIRRKPEGMDGVLAEAAEYLKDAGVIDGSFACTGSSSEVPDSRLLTAGLCCAAASEGFMTAVVRNDFIKRDYMFGMRMAKSVMIDEIQLGAAFILTVSPSSEIEPLMALEHMTHLLRRMYQEKSPERAKYENNLKKMVETLEII